MRLSYALFPSISLLALRLCDAEYPCNFCSNDSGGRLKLHSGGYTGAFRGIYGISVALSEHPAATKCQFSGNSRTSRLPFQRENVQILQFMQQLQHFKHKL